MALLKVTNQVTGKDFYVNPSAVVLAEPGQTPDVFTVTVMVGSEDKRFQIGTDDLERISRHGLD